MISNSLSKNRRNSALPVLAGLLTFILALAPIQTFSQETQSKKTSPRAALVSVDKVSIVAVSQIIPVLGRLVARRSGVVAARVAGPVAEMRCDVGDRMKKGDVVAVLVRERLHWIRERRKAQVASNRALLASRKAELVKKNQEMARLE